MITDIFDNDSARWGEQLGCFIVRPPGDFSGADYDKVVIATTLYTREVREQLLYNMQVDAGCIENSLFFARVKIMKKYKDMDDAEIRMILDYLEDHNLDVFNYPFAEKYFHMDADIGFDDEVGMFYVNHCGMRMYMARHLDTREKVLHYYQGILMEQDALSPHRYLDDSFSVSDGDVVVDVGTAEGNFAMEVIDRASKIYLVEAEENWVEALQYTFANYRNRVVIIRGYASDVTEGNKMALDDVIKEKVNFIKMDVEGAEPEALAGARRLLGNSDRLKCAVCAYHNNEDEERIRDFAQSAGLKISVTNGYMYYTIGCGQRYFDPVLRRGIVRLEK